MDEEPQVPVSLLSAALDEIYLLRSMAAVQALEMAEILRYRTVPHNARKTASTVLQRLILCARGEAWRVHKGIGFITRREALLEVGAQEGYTRSDLEREMVLRKAEEGTGRF